METKKYTTSFSNITVSVITKDSHFITDVIINEYSLHIFYGNSHKKILKHSIQSMNKLLVSVSDDKFQNYYLTFYPRFKLSDYLHLSRSDTKLLVDFILYHCKPESEKRDDIIDSLLED